MFVPCLEIWILGFGLQLGCRSVSNVPTQLQRQQVFEVSFFLACRGSQSQIACSHKLCIHTP